MDRISVIKGIVVHGKALGRTVGMPTANLSVTEGELPEAGVYATKIICRGESHISLTNIGCRPSVDEDSAITVEAHILDFDEDIYGEAVTLEVYAFIRPVMKFDGLEAVQEQVAKDIEWTQRYFLKR